MCKREAKSGINLSLTANFRCPKRWPNEVFFGSPVKQTQLPPLTEFVTLKTQLVLNFLLLVSIIYIFLYAVCPKFYSFCRRLDSAHRGGHPTTPHVRLWSQECTNPDRATPDLGPPSLSAHESRWTGTPHYAEFWFTATLNIALRGGYRFRGAWRVYNFWGPLLEKEYKSTNTKLGTKVNIYLRPIPEALEGGCASEGPWSLSFISFTVNPPLKAPPIRLNTDAISGFECIVYTNSKLNGMQ